MNFKKSKNLSGVVTIPGDKSISHRALILSSMAIGTTHIHGLLEAEDVMNTAKALQALGVSIKKREDGIWEVNGVGIGGLSEPEQALDMGNSGTGARLLMGLVAPYPFTTFFVGDKSLTKRPMNRVISPLKEMGANFTSRSGGRLPLAVIGNDDLTPVSYMVPVASAQVKSAILLAALNTNGNTTVVEKIRTRDHTELMMEDLGIKIHIREAYDAKYITIEGKQDLVFKNKKDIGIPGDPSSASFLIAAALITEGSDVLLRNVCLNETRVGILKALFEMGANISFENIRCLAGEDVADLRVKHSKLKGVEVPANMAPFMIDEYPILAVIATCAEGKTTMKGLGELKVKESDRLQAMYDGLTACGVNATMGEDYLIVEGGTVKGGATIKTHMDHRIAMSFLILGIVSEAPVIVDDIASINTSFPEFFDLCRTLGIKE